MTDGNGDGTREFPAQMGEALRAARSGKHVSLEVLRGAVCAYLVELTATGLDDDAIRRRVFSAFEQVNGEAPLDLGSLWSNELVDELIAWCRDRQLQM